MLRLSLADALSEVSESEPRPRLNIGLTDGKTIRLVNWVVANECLIERWPNGSPQYLLPLAKIVSIEIPERD